MPSKTEKVKIQHTKLQEKMRCTSLWIGRGLTSIAADYLLRSIRVLFPQEVTVFGWCM
ncbi:hypothetical protein QJS04_geneDACA017387 [Acorus gramineus]|uniref:Uncharacterized protein n=1 Tax=Acorus gramineus TaxID=55184 RepID=A0AAV9A1N1_ACOGR|nr:hypothetical protein QJS04_geneDACA017387 [Acorus gramineus]